MIDLLKKLFDRRQENITLVLLDDGRADSPETYSLKPYSFFALIIGLNLILLLVISLFLYVTPLGNMLFDKDDREVRRSILAISERVQNLQDSLNARDQQLTDIRNVIAQGHDTTFSITPMENVEMMFEGSPQMAMREPVSGFPTFDANLIIYSGRLKLSPAFPAAPPLQGTLTRVYDAEKGHYGVDIAAVEGSQVKVIADGVVTNVDWTLNYGYVVHVQHGDGYISTYKHCSNVNKRKGDVIFRGDILGTVGKSGVLTSGPHLHFELWRDGIPLDPALHLTNLNN